MTSTLIKNKHYAYLCVYKEGYSTYSEFWISFSVAELKDVCSLLFFLHLSCFYESLCP